MDFQGKVVLITGSASGLGKNTAQSFLQKGSKVCISDIDVEKGKDTLNVFQEQYGEANVIFCKCNVANKEEFKGVFEECEKKLGVVDILMNNAGVYDENDWRKTIEVNYGGMVNGCELALQKMGKQNGGKGGHVINIASIAAVSRFFLSPLYAASKAATVQYTRSIGHEFHYSYTGVSFQALCPDSMQTRFNTRVWETYYTPETLAKMKTIHSVDKLTTAEVTEVIFQLLNDNKPGAIMVMEAKGKPYYCPPSFLKEI